MLVEALASGIEAGGHVIAVLPQWFPPEGALRLAMARSMLDTDRVAVHETALPPLAGAVLCSLASALAPHVPSAGVLASLLPELEAELHVFTWLGSRDRAQRARAELRPAPRLARARQRVRRLLVARAGRAQALGRRARRPAAGDRRGRRGWSSRRAPATPRWARDDDQRRARRPARGRGRADAATGPSGGAPASSSRAWCSRSTSPSSRRELVRRARAVGLPLVPRADRPLAVPAVRPPRAPRPSSRRGRRISRAASASRCREPGCGPSSARRGHRRARVEPPAARSAAARRARSRRSSGSAARCAQVGSQTSVSTRRRGRSCARLPQPDQRRPSSRLLAVDPAGGSIADAVREVDDGDRRPPPRPARAPRPSSSGCGGRHGRRTSASRRPARRRRRRAGRRALLAPSSPPQPATRQAGGRARRRARRGARASAASAELLCRARRPGRRAGRSARDGPSAGPSARARRGRRSRCSIALRPRHELARRVVRVHGLRERAPALVHCCWNTPWESRSPYGEVVTPGLDDRRLPRRQADLGGDVHAVEDLAHDRGAPAGRAGRRDAARRRPRSPPRSRPVTGASQSISLTSSGVVLQRARPRRRPSRRRRSPAARVDVHVVEVVADLPDRVEAELVEQPIWRVDDRLLVARRS